MYVYVACYITASNHLSIKNSYQHYVAHSHFLKCTSKRIWEHKQGRIPPIALTKFLCKHNCKKGLLSGSIFIDRSRARSSYISFNKRKFEVIISTMRMFATGFILLVLVASTLGDALPRSLQEDAHPLQGNANSGRHHYSCLVQFINCIRNRPQPTGRSFS